jgi:hypothetical protein
LALLRLPEIARRLLIQPAFRRRIESNPHCHIGIDGARLALSASRPIAKLTSMPAGATILY